MNLTNGIPTDITTAISQSNLDLEPGALEPLRSIDFAKLVTIHDHEENFLRRTFLDTLMGLTRARISSGGGSNKITAKDVKTALLMLGTAASEQADATLSKQTRSLIKEACPFCV